MDSREKDKMHTLNQISILSIEGFHIGNAEYAEGGTGVTVILADEKTPCGCDVRGGGPASRENALLNPLAANDSVNAVVLSGGSAFGLASGNGVMKYLEEKGKGFPTASGVVPIVTESCIFDLEYKNAKIRPDEKLGYQACLKAEENNYTDGCYGAGCGATVGKMCGPEYMMKSGIGSAAYECGSLKVGALMAVNCAGDVFENGRQIAGAFDPQTKTFLNCEEAMYRMQTKISTGTNTTIGCILTNAALDKTALTKVCGMGHDGMARAISPVHAMYDGDTLYAMGTGKVKTDVNIVGVLAARCVQEAIVSALRHAGQDDHLLTYNDIFNR
jgi:L-aminopeptidase/D-esterase-like protein